MTYPRSPSESADRLSRAIEMLDAYGADPRRWPTDEAALFEALKDDPHFDRARRDAAALDAALSDAPSMTAGEVLQEAILEQYSTLAVIGETWADALIRLCTHGAGRLLPIGAAAGLSALGFAIGAANADFGAAEDDALYYALDTSMIAIEEGNAQWADEL